MGVAHANARKSREKTHVRQLIRVMYDHRRTRAKQKQGGAHNVQTTQGNKQYREASAEVNDTW